MVPEIDDPVLFEGAFQFGMEPVPLALIPIAVLLLLQLKDPPAGELEKVPMDIISEGQTVTSLKELTTGVGLIMILKLTEAPEHPAAVAITVICEVKFEPVLFTGAVQLGILPTPEEADKPTVEKLPLAVQLNVDPPTELLNEIADIVAPGQALTSETAATVGLGFTVTVTEEVTDVPHVLVTFLLYNVVVVSTGGS